MPIFRALFVIVVVIMVGSCNSYEPDLGDVPFRCGTEEPRCPEGYGAVVVDPPILCECRRGESDTVFDGGPSDSG